MNYSLETLRRAIKSLETSVYVYDNGYTRSLPWINSKRIDVLRGGIKALSKAIEELDPGHQEERINNIEITISGTAGSLPTNYFIDSTSTTNISDAFTTLYDMLVNNSTVTTTTGDNVNVFDVSITTNPDDPQLQLGQVDPVHGNVITQADIDAYIEKISNIKTSAQEVYDILVYLKTHSAEVSFTITPSADDIQNISSGINPITGEVMTEAKRQEYITNLNKITTVFQLLYDMIIYLENTSSGVVPQHQMNVFDGMEI